MANWLLPNDASREERLRAIAIAQSELKARGIEFKTKTYKRAPWTIDPKGYFPRVDGQIYRPKDQQDAFIRNNSYFSAFIGGRGSGKTAAGAQRALKRIQQGASGAVLSPDFEHFRTSTWPELSRWIPWHYVIRGQRYMRMPSYQPRAAFNLTFINGAFMLCKGLKDPDSARGPNINWLWYDEGGRDKTGESWLYAIPAVRIRVGNLMPGAWVTTTPRGKQHWIYKLFGLKQVPDKVFEILSEMGWKGELVQMFQGSIEENKEHLDPMFYVAMLTAYGTGWLAEQELGGAFVEPGGALAERHWFPIVPAAPAAYQSIVRFWDLAATAKEQARDDPDFTAGGKLIYDKGMYYIADIRAGQLRWADIKALIVQTARLDGQRVPIRIEQSPGDGGKNSIAEITSMPELLNYDVAGIPARQMGDKVQRANPWFGQAKVGNVRLVEGSWNEAFLNEVEVFPEGAHDDQVDCVSGAVYSLSQIVNLENFVQPLPESRWERIKGMSDARVQKESRWRV